MQTNSINIADSMSPFPTFRPEMAFPYLTDEMIGRIRSYGMEETSVPDIILWTRGDREVDMFVVLQGEVEVYAQEENGVSKTLTTLRTGQFSGELDLLNSRRTLVNGRTLSECRLLRVPRAELQRLMRSEGDIANLIMQATIWRRLGILERAASNMVLLGRSTAAETIQLQRFLHGILILTGFLNLRRSGSLTQSHRRRSSTCYRLSSSPTDVCCINQRSQNWRMSWGSRNCWIRK